MVLINHLLSNLHWICASKLKYFVHRSIFRRGLSCWHLLTSCQRSPSLHPSLLQTSHWFPLMIGWRKRKVGANIAKFCVFLFSEYCTILFTDCKSVISIYFSLLSTSLANESSELEVTNCDFKLVSFKVTNCDLENSFA